MLRFIFFVLMFSFLSVPVLAEEIKMKCGTDLYKYTASWMGSVKVKRHEDGNWIPICLDKKTTLKITKRSTVITGREATCLYEGIASKGPIAGLQWKGKTILDFQLKTLKLSYEFPENPKAQTGFSIKCEAINYNPLQSNPLKKG